MTMLTDRLA
jgi:hypothetical protein